MGIFNLGTSLVFLGIIWMIANGQLLAYTTFGPQFFKLHDVSTQGVGLLTSMAMLVSIFITPNFLCYQKWLNQNTLVWVWQQ